MKTYSGSNASSQIEPVLWNARETVWIISPWLGKEYANRLASLSQKGIEVRIITSNQDFNLESLETFRASANPNLKLLVLDKNKPKESAAFVHSKLYIVDNSCGISGSANLTYSGLNSNVESLNIAETEAEVQQIKGDFSRIWLEFERKSMSKEELSSGTSYSIRNALPLLQDFGKINQPTMKPALAPIIKSKELIYHPYYFFEFSFRTSVGTSPSVLFEDHGFVVLDGVTRQIVEDTLLDEEINNPVSIGDYVLKTNNEYRLEIHPKTIGEFQEARELVLKHIQEKNTKHYEQDYYRTVRDRIFVPYPSIIRFAKSGFVQVPIWYVEMCELDGSRHQDVIFGSSGRKWTELVYCADCQRKIENNQAITCEICGKKFCSNCIKKTGFIFKKKLCGLCLSES